MTQDKDLTVKRRLVDLVLSGGLPKEVQKELLARYACKGETTEDFIFWEKHYPGLGRQFLAILSPWYVWDAKMRMPIDELKDAARDAVPWRAVARVKAYSPADIKRMHEEMDLDFWESFQDSLLGTMGHALGEDAQAELRGLMRVSLWDDLEKLFIQNLCQEITSQLSFEPWMDCLDQFGLKLWNTLWRAYAASIAKTLGDLLFYSCGFALQDRFDQVVKLQKLLRLFLAGNYPIGFAKGSGMLFLVSRT